MYTLVADAWYSKAHKQDLSWSVEKGTRHRPKEQVAGVNCSNVGYQSRHQCAAVQLSSCAAVQVFGLTFWVTFGVRKRSRQESVCVRRWLSWNWKPRGFSWSRRMLLTQAHHLKPCSASNSRSVCLACILCQYGHGVTRGCIVSSQVLPANHSICSQLQWPWQQPICILEDHLHESDNLQLQVAALPSPTG